MKHRRKLLHRLRALENAKRALEAEAKEIMIALLEGKENEVVVRDWKKVYIFHCKDIGRVKIGVSREPESRVKNILAGLPKELDIRLCYCTEEKEYAGLIEKAAHRKLFYCRTPNSEWFDCSVEVAIEAVKFAVGGIEPDEEEEGGNVRKMHTR